MPTPITGTVRISGPVSPFNVEDTYPATDPQYGLGGLRTVGTTTDMEAIPASRRQVGMMVYVSGATAFYSLVGTTANSGWTTSFQMGAGTNILPLNNTFTGVNTFTAGISASGLTVGNIRAINNSLDFSNVDGFPTISGVTSGGLIPLAQFDSTSGHFRVTSYRWSLGNQNEDQIGSNYEATISGNSNTGFMRLEAGNRQITLSAVGDISLIGNSTVTGLLSPSSGLSAAGGITFNGTVNGATATFNRLLTASAGISASNGAFGTLQTNSGATFNSDVYMGATLTVQGNFIVNGSTTIINSTTIEVDDKLILLAQGITLNAALNDGGIELGSGAGATPKSIKWINATSAWTSSEDFNLVSGKVYEINGTTVLSSSALGTGITSSSLQSVGTISSGTWQGTQVGVQYGGTGVTLSTKGDLLVGAAASNTYLRLPVSTTNGQFLGSDGSDVAWRSISLGDASANSVATLTGGTYRIRDATSSLKGLASFDSFNFTVTNGLVDIAAIDGGVYA